MRTLCIWSLHDYDFASKAHKNIIFFTRRARVSILYDIMTILLRAERGKRCDTRFASYTRRRRRRRRRV